MATDPRLNDAIFDYIAADGPVVRSAAKAIGRFTRLKMHRLWHIPNRYFLDPTLEPQLYTLWQEIGRYGCIDLDAGGTPCVLSGKPPVLGPEYEHPRQFDPEYYI